LCPQATLALKETKAVIKWTQYTVKEKQSRSENTAIPVPRLTPGLLRQETITQKHEARVTKVSKG